MALIYKQLTADSFHRADENPLNPLQWNDDPAHVNAACQIVSNQLMPTASESIAINTAIVWPNDQWCQLQINVNQFTGPPGSFNYASTILVGRRQDFHNGYAFEIDGPLGPACNAQLFKLVAGTPTVFFDGVIALRAGDTMRLECFGTTISAKVNGVVVASVVDTSFSSGPMAIDLFEDTLPTDAQSCNFAGGSITVAEGVTPPNVTDKSSPTMPLMPQGWPLTLIGGSDPLVAETEPQLFDHNNAIQVAIVTEALIQSGNTGNRLV